MSGQSISIVPVVSRFMGVGREAGHVGLSSLYSGAVQSSVQERVVEGVETLLYIDARRDPLHANALSVAVPCYRGCIGVSSSRCSSLFAVRHLSPQHSGPAK